MTENVVTLGELAESLIADLPSHKSGKAAKTILSGSVMRAVVIALAEGAELSEHDSPPAATLYAITGEVTLFTHTESWTLQAGQLVPIPRHRHAVRAHVDSAFLLTVGLR